MLGIVRRVVVLAAGLIALAGTVHPALAQDELETPDLSSFQDANGINVLAGQPNIPLESISVGDPQNGGLSYARSLDNKGNATNNLFARIRDNGAGEYTVIIDGGAKEFWNALIGGGKVEARLEGHTLWQSADKTQMVYTRPDGTRYVFLDDTLDSHKRYVLRSVTRPDGDVLTYHYDLVSTVFSGQTTRTYTLRSVNNALGYQIRLNYSSANVLTDVVALNNAVEYCSTSGLRCDPVGPAWQRMTFGGNCPAIPTPGVCYRTASVNGQQTTYNYNNTKLTSIVYPSGRSILYTRDLPGTGNVVTVQTLSGSWTYQFGSGFTRSTDPNGGQITYYYNSVTREAVERIVDELGRTTFFYHDDSVRLTRMVYPEGNALEYDYDGRGNITQARSLPKPGSGLAVLVSTAGYDVTCGNTLTCNRPNYVVDARGARTDFTYSAVHGGLLTRLGPAPSAGQPRPESRFTYQPLSAWTLNGAGARVAGTPVYRRTVERQCAGACL